MTGPDAPTGVSVRTRFERFPATVKGAFVIRGEDADPHQVRFVQARVVRVPGGGSGVSLAIDPVVVDVAPHHDVFVPFEFTVADLEPGWYALESQLEVDGARRIFPGDRRFVVPWPRSQVRRGTVQVGRSAAIAGGATVELSRLEMEATSLTLHYSVSPPEPVDIRLSAGASRVEPLGESYDPATGKGKVSAYPLPVASRTLRIEIAPGRRGRGRGAASVEVDLR